MYYENMDKPEHLYPNIHLWPYIVRIFFGITMTSMFSIVSLQVLEKLDFKVLDYGIFSELDIMEYFFNYYFKHA